MFNIGLNYNVKNVEEHSTGSEQPDDITIVVIKKT